MTQIQIFDPALCCSTGVCGLEVDPALVRLAADLAWAQQNGAQVQRFNLAQEPMAFAQNPRVSAFLQRSGPEALPLVLLDGEIALAGRYPQRAELARWASIALTPADAAPDTPAHPATAPSPEQAGACCAGGRCC